MPLLDYEPKSYPRAWLARDADLSSWAAIEPWFRKLLERPVRTADELQVWLRDAGELQCAVSQVGTKRYVAMTCQTDDPAREAAYLEFVREIEPRLKPQQQAIREKYLDSPARSSLPADQYAVFDRTQVNQRALYREANVPRETELAELEQQYQKTVGAMTVQFEGEERTLAQMARYFEETDRDLRERAWRLVAERRLKERELLDSLFDRMRGLRMAIAHEAGFPSFVDYAYRKRERFDYGRKECEAFHTAIEQSVVPLAARLYQERREALGLDSLRPWDLSVDPLGRPPLRPFQDAEQLARGAENILRRVDPELGAQFGYLKHAELLDLSNRKGKAPGGYQTTFDELRLPFIFMNAVGLDGDLRTILHEAGHAFHSLASRGFELAAYRDAPIEFCEVASMSMELLGAPELEEFYTPADAARSYRQLLEGIVTILPWIATVDAFQHWLYDHPEHDARQRRKAWAELIERFGGPINWSGLEEARDHGWHRQLHIFLYPFYYIEYGIAQLGALQVWQRAKTDRKGAVAAYRQALALGGSRPLPELFHAAGLVFDWSQATIEPLMAEIERELDRLEP
jgi:oligoendopeptidase F